MQKYDDHPLAELFPLLAGAELEDLTQSILEHGFQGAITLYEGRILDGRNRYRAAIKAGVEPKTREYKDGSPLDFVLMANLHRRHLTESQRAMVAAKIANLPHGRSEKKKEANLPLTPTITEAATKLSVSPRLVREAKSVLKSPSQTKAVINGTKTVHAAAADIKAAKEKKEVVRDETGYPVPGKALPFWNRRQEIRDLVGLISRARGALRKIDVDNDAMFVETNVNNVIAKLNQAYTELSTSIPYAVCPTCQGQAPDTCNLCKGRGVISEFKWSTAVPQEMKDIRAKLSA